MVTSEGIIAVYILASQKNGTLYVGVTSDLARRVFEHRSAATPGFSSRYGVKRLVWYRPHDLIVEAIAEEKRLKKYKRAWKIELIEALNPDWDDFYLRLNR